MIKNSLNGKTILIILVISIITILVIFKYQYNSEKPKTSLEENTIHPKALTFSDVKRNNLLLFEKKFNTSNITVVFFEYRNNNVKEALIIRQDSVTSIYSQLNPSMLNSFNNDTVALLSFQLLDIMDKQINELPFEEPKKKMMLKKPKKITVSIKTNNGQILSLNINHFNKDESLYKEILNPFINLINIINNSDISIEKLIANPENIK